MLEIEDLSVWVKSKGVDRKVLSNVSLSISRGEVVSVIGESGSGKTMTALALMRLLPYAAIYGKNSKVIFEGCDLLDISERQMRTVRGAQIAIIFQDPHTSLNPVLKVGKQITEVLALHGNLRGREAYIAALHLLDQVQIANPVTAFEKYPFELSGGMKQRVAIAMALACKPTLLIADEATTALDVTIQAEIIQLLSGLQKNTGMSLMFITHNLALAAQVSDQVIVMQKGGVVEKANTETFFCGPQNAYAKKLLRSVQKLEPAISVGADRAVEVMSVTDLRVYYPIRAGILRMVHGYVKAVDGVSLQIYAGRTLAVVGGSGCGKTSLAKAMVGLLPEARGMVMFAGLNLLGLGVRKWKKYRSDIQFIFQDPFAALDAKLTVVKSLLEGVMNLKVFATQAEAMEKLDQLMCEVGLDPTAKHRYPHEFSGGERQRLCIVRALMLHPKIIVCDEPASSLDVSVQATVLDLLTKLQQKYNIAYLIITHDFGVIARMAHQVAVMHDGVVVEHGDVRQVLFKPQNDYTKKLLASVPKI